MKTYFKTIEITLKEYLAYRLNFLLWRFRVFLSLVVLFFLWQAAFDNTKTIGHYQPKILFSYIFYANFLANFVLGTRTTDIANEINSGEIINYLLKPISFFRYYFSRDMADKLLNLFFSFFEILLLVILFKIPLVKPKQIVLGTVFLINGVLLSFFINLIISFIGFWSREIWGPRFLFSVLVFFISGSYFPLDLLAKPIYYLFLATPFPYLFYLPTKIFLGEKFPFFLLFFAIGWTVIFYYLAKKIWQAGIKNFAFWSR
jgi:ABC-2 type transport system permease protein